MAKKTTKITVYALVTHLCGHTVDWEFHQPVTEKERQECKIELQRKTTEPCPDCAPRCENCGAREVIENGPAAFEGHLCKLCMDELWDNYVGQGKQQRG